MTKKEHTTITELFQVLDLLESLDMQFWLDGGWGVDVLYGQQTRLHRDIDIDFDANYTDQLLDLLQERGYQIVTVSEMARARGITLENGAKYYNFYK